MEEQNTTQSSSGAPINTPAQQGNTESPEDKKDIEENKLIAALSYLGILALVPLLAKKESKFAQFHAKQGVIFLIIWVVGWFIFWIPVIGWLLLLAVAVLDIIGLVKALSGEYWKAPVIGDWAKKLNL